MAYFHPALTQEKWNAYGKTKQILNIASELSRTRNLIKDSIWDSASNSLDRALELIDLTISDTSLRSPQRYELLRLREWLGQYYNVFDNKSADELRQLTKILCSFDKDAQQVEV